VREAHRLGYFARSDGRRANESDHGLSSLPRIMDQAPRLP
jgi:hypothetical protein